MTAACPTKVFAVPASNPSRYNDKMKTCHPRAMANQARTRILINKQRFSRNFHRFFRGRDSKKENWRIAAFRCIGILTLGYFSSVPDLLHPNKISEINFFTSSCPRQRLISSPRGSAVSP
jgi:hypothetical protein